MKFSEGDDKDTLFFLISEYFMNNNFLSIEKKANDQDIQVDDLMEDFHQTYLMLESVKNLSKLYLKSTNNVVIKCPNNQESNKNLSKILKNNIITINSNSTRNQNVHPYFKRKCAVSQKKSVLSSNTEKITTTIKKKNKYSEINPYFSKKKEPNKFLISTENVKKNQKQSLQRKEYHQKNNIKKNNYSTKNVVCDTESINTFNTYNLTNSKSVAFNPFIGKGHKSKQSYKFAPRRKTKDNHFPKTIRSMEVINSSINTLKNSKVAKDEEEIKFFNLERDSLNNNNNINDEEAATSTNNHDEFSEEYSSNVNTMSYKLTQRTSSNNNKYKIQKRHLNIKTEICDYLIPNNNDKDSNKNIDDIIEENHNIYDINEEYNNLCNDEGKDNANKNDIKMHDDIKNNNNNEEKSNNKILNTINISGEKSEYKKNNINNDNKESNNVEPKINLNYQGILNNQSVEIKINDLIKNQDIPNLINNNDIQIIKQNDGNLNNIKQQSSLRNNNYFIIGHKKNLSELKVILENEKNIRKDNLNMSLEIKKNIIIKNINNITIENNKDISIDNLNDGKGHKKRINSDDLHNANNEKEGDSIAKQKVINNNINDSNNLEKNKNIDINNLIQDNMKTISNDSIDRNMDNKKNLDDSDDNFENLDSSMDEKKDLNENKNDDEKNSIDELNIKHQAIKSFAFSTITGKENLEDKDNDPNMNYLLKIGKKNFNAKFISNINEESKKKAVVENDFKNKNKFEKHMSTPHIINHINNISKENKNINVNVLNGDFNNNESSDSSIIENNKSDDDDDEEDDNSKKENKNKIKQKNEIKNNIITKKNYNSSIFTINNENNIKILYKIYSFFNNKNNPFINISKFTRYVYLNKLLNEISNDITKLKQGNKDKSLTSENESEASLRTNNSTNRENAIKLKSFENNRNKILFFLEKYK